MTIFPQVAGSSPGSLAGIADVLADLKRQVAALSSNRTYIGSSSIIGDNIAATSIVTSHLTAGLITASYIAAGAINASHIAANTITAGQIAAGTITATEIATHTITALKIAAGTITATEIAAGTITATQIAANTITASQIAANTITASQIAAATITATQIATGTITGSLLVSGTITATQIAANTITAAQIAADSITATEIFGSTLSAISADMGSLTAGTITGGKIRTASSGARVELGSSITTSEGTYTGLVGVDGSNNVTLLVNAATGDVQIKGTIRTGSSGLGNISGAIDGTTNITSATIDNSRLIANTITAAKIAAGTITATEIASVTITAGKIATGTITATQLAAGTITTDKISVGGNLNSLINGGFEDVSATDATMAANWNRAVNYAGSNSTVLRHSGAAHGGAYGMKLVPGTGASGDAAADPIPVNVGEVWTLSFWARKTGSGATSAYVGVWLCTSAARANADIPGGWQFGNTDLSTTWVKYSFTYTIPTSYSGFVPTWGYVSLLNHAANTGGTMEIDDVEFSKASIATDIAPGVITTTQLNATAIDGMTITGALIRTSASNPRIEITGGGSGALKKYDSGGETPVVLGSTDGLDLLTGTTATPPTDRKIRWMSGSASVSELVSYRTGTGTNTLSVGKFEIFSAEGTPAGTGIGFNSFGSTAGGQGEAIVYASSISGTFNSSLKVIDSDGVSDLQKMRVPAGKIRATGTGQSFTTSTSLTKVLFDTTDQDQYYTGETASGSAHADLTNDRLVCRKAGLYLVTGHLGWTANATAVRQLAIYKNGTLEKVVSATNTTASVNHYLEICAVVSLAATDYVELFAAQNSGGNLSLIVTAYSPVLDFIRLGTT